jgi:hypothetical protein
MIVLVLILSGCAVSADPPAQVTKDGCTLDLKKACQYVLDKATVVSTQDGLPLTRQRFENISVRHVEVLVPFMSSGTQLRCVFDTETARATDAHLSSGPSLNDTDMEHVRKDG